MFANSEGSILKFSLYRASFSFSCEKRIYINNKLYLYHAKKGYKQHKR